MNKHQHDRDSREHVQRRDVPRADRASDGDQDKPRRSRHAPYHRERQRYTDEWDAD